MVIKSWTFPVHILLFFSVILKSSTERKVTTMNPTDTELIRKLKYGRTDELAMLAEEMKPDYADSFPAFMEQILREKKLKRVQIARRAGLSQDYLYKILRGDKRTTERDYIIAICMAAKMNIAQTQHTLRIYGMPLLDRHDMRSNVIYVHIEDGASMDTLNERLEAAHLLPLRTNPEMEKAIIAPNASPEAEPQETATENETAVPVHERELPWTGELQEIGSKNNAEHCGNAPFDYSYWAEIQLEDDEGHQFRVQAYFGTDGSTGFTAMTEEQFQTNEALRKAAKPGDGEPYDKYQMLEWYETLAETSVSPFFTWYLELDERTDQKVIETLNRVDDTRYCPGGMRIGGKWGHGGPMIYMESFNTAEPGRREYFQITQEGDRYTFSATHESIYMRMELDKIYPSIFGKSPDIEYWINVTSLDDIREDQQRIHHIFYHLLLILHRNSEQPFESLQPSEDTLLQEEMNALKDQAANCSRTGAWEEGILALDRLQQVMRKLIGRGHDLAVSMIFSEVNRAYALEQLERWDEAATSWRKAYDMKTEFSDNSDTAKPLGMAAYHLASIVKNEEEASALYREAADLLEQHCDFRPAAIMYFLSCTRYAFSIDGEETDTAVGYYRKAISVARRYHLDQNNDLRIAIAGTYNNLAWVLWNLQDSEEAAIYYGMGLDLDEEWLRDPEMDQQQVLRQFSHIGTALYKFYIDTNKPKEASRILERQKAAGASLEES